MKSPESTLNTCNLVSKFQQTPDTFWSKHNLKLYWPLAGWVNFTKKENLFVYVIVATYIIRLIVQILM